MLTPGANCKGNVSLINANIIIVFLGYTCQKTISMNNTFRDCKSKVNITSLLGDLGPIKQYCKLPQIQFFWDCDAIENITLRLWKFSNFCSRHTVGVASDYIMFHILVNDCIHVNTDILSVMLWIYFNNYQFIILTATCVCEKGQLLNRLKPL